MVKPEDFTSRWEYSKATSNYHFDPTVKEDDNPPFTYLGSFSGDWQEELARCARLAPKTKVHFGNRLVFNVNEVPYTDVLDKNDLRAMNVAEDWTLYTGIKVPKFGFDKLRYMIDFFCLESTEVSIHAQGPGNVFFYHVDNLTGMRKNKNETEILEHPENVIRFSIALGDWVPGHVYAFGNTYWKQWKAGDIITHEWINIPHGTANLSPTTRYTLQVTGFKTEKTREILKSKIIETVS